MMSSHLAAQTPDSDVLLKQVTPKWKCNLQLMRKSHCIPLFNCILLPLYMPWILCSQPLIYLSASYRPIDNQPLFFLMVPLPTSMSYFCKEIPSLPHYRNPLIRLLICDGFLVGGWFRGIHLAATSKAYATMSSKQYLNGAFTFLRSRLMTILYSCSCFNSCMCWTWISWTPSTASTYFANSLLWLLLLDVTSTFTFLKVLSRYFEVDEFTFGWNMDSSSNMTFLLKILYSLSHCHIPWKTFSSTLVLTFLRSHDNKQDC